jgi:uroporphyrinogen decarboxylase
MKHRERVQMALNHEQPDRCPLQVGFTPEFAARLRPELCVLDRREHNPHGGGNAYELELALDQDMLLTSVGWANSYYQADHDYVDEWGIAWSNVAYETQFGRGHYTEMTGHPLANDEAIASYRPPDPHREELYRDAAWTLQQFHDEYWIVGVAVTTIFETAWALRGYEQMLIDLVADPDLAAAILDIPFHYHLAVAQRLVHMGVDMIWVGDDVGSQAGMLFAPELWRRVLKPRMAEFFATLKRLNPALKIAYHSDGFIEPIIPDLIEIGLDVLNPVQPACMDPARLKQLYGNHLAFWGTIDEQHTLPFGSPADVTREVRTRLETVGCQGGLIIGPTHHVQLDTPLENFWAMIHAVTGTGKTL